MENPNDSYFVKIWLYKMEGQPTISKASQLDWPSDESQVNGRTLPLRTPLGFKHHCLEGACISFGIHGTDIFIYIDLMFIGKYQEIHHNYTWILWV